MTQPWRIVSIAVALVAAGAGVAIGAWVDRTSPNPVYGAQVILLGVGILIVVIGLLVARRGPVGQTFALSSVALLCGMSIGAQFLGAPKPVFSRGTMTLRVEGSPTITVSGAAQCMVDGDEVWASADFENVPIKGGVYLTVHIVEGDTAMDETGSTIRDDRRMLTIAMEALGAAATPSGGHGEPAEPFVEPEGSLHEGSRAGELVSTNESVLVGEVDESSGSLRFAELTARAYSEAPSPWFDDLDLTGAVEWSCSE